MLATGALILGALAASDLSDRIGALQIDTAERRRQTPAAAGTKFFAAAGGGGDSTGYCQLRHLEAAAFPDPTDWEPHQEELFQLQPNDFAVAMDALSEECKPCIQTCYDQHVDSSGDFVGSQSDFDMIACSLQCVRTTPNAVCDEVEYAMAVSDGHHNLGEYNFSTNRPFKNLAITGECRDCARKCAEDTVMKVEEPDSVDFDVGDDGEVDFTQAFVELAKLLIVHREYSSCMRCCAGIEMHTYEDALPEGETCATAEFGKERVQEYELFGFRMTITQIYMVLAGAGAVALCILFTCCCLCCK